MSGRRQDGLAALTLAVSAALLLSPVPPALESWAAGLASQVSDLLAPWWPAGDDSASPPPLDKATHVVLFALVTLGLHGAIRRRVPAAVAVTGLFAMFWGTLLEAAQGWIAARSSDPGDLVANGVGVGLSIAVLLTMARPSPPARSRSVT